MARFALHFVDGTEIADLEFLDTVEAVHEVFEGYRGFIEATPYDPSLPDVEAAREAAYQATMRAWDAGKVRFFGGRASCCP